VAPREPKAARRGRPLKFGRPARSVTVTLPEDVLTALRARNRDVGRAIVDLLAGSAGRKATAPSVVMHQNGRRSVIVVRPAEALRKLAGVELVSLGDPDRALIALTGGQTVSAFELQVQDLLEGPALPALDGTVVAQLAALLRQARRNAGRSLREASIIVMDDVRKPAARGTVRGRSGRGTR
jgi:hypothetical protein